MPLPEQTFGNPCRGIIGTVTFISSQTIGCRISLYWNGRGPGNDELSLFIIIENFRCPHIVSQRVFHHFDFTLFAPMNQVFRTGITKSLFPIPTDGPHQMKGSIRTLVMDGSRIIELGAYFCSSVCLVK